MSERGNVVRIGDELSALMGRAEPEFYPCGKCGVTTSGRLGICWRCDQEKQRAQRSKELAEAAIPESFRWARFGSPTLVERCHGDELLVARARDSVKEKRVVLVGASGVGKTSLAVAMLREWVDAHLEPTAFVLATELATARRRERMGREAPEVVEALTAPILCLDDLGTDTPEATSPMAEVVFKRHAEAMPTWITTWMTPTAMQVRYGDGFARRVFEGARVIDCGRSP